MPFAWGKGFKVVNPNFKEICLFVLVVVVVVVFPLQLKKELRNKRDSLE